MRKVDGVIVKTISKRDNLEIECYRIFFTISVAVLHFSEDYTGTRGIIPGGYLGVDFFFMLSGYLMMKHWVKSQKQGSAFSNTFRYFSHRIKRLYPPYLVATIVMLLVQWSFEGFGIRELASYLWRIRWQLVCLHFLGMPAEFNMRSVWYISTLIFLTWIIFFLIDRDLDLFIGIAPAISILILVYLARKYGTLTQQGSYDFVFNGGLLRGFSEMSIGAVLPFVSKEINRRLNIEKEHIRFYGITIKLLCGLTICGIMFSRGFDEADFVVIPAIALLLIITEIRPLISRGGGSDHYMLSR